MKINICTGYPLDSPRGNTTTALRIEKLLRSAGYDAIAMHTDTPPAAEAQISLHALKTAAASIYFAQHCPTGRLYVRLTGTDMHGGFSDNPVLAGRVIKVARNLVVAHTACLPRIPTQWRSKVVVIYPSIELPQLPAIQSFSLPLFTTIGHLRPVKNPHLMYAALRLAPDLKVAGRSIGNAYDVTDEQQALLNARQDDRYRWIAGCHRPEAIAWIKASLATINSSFSEGGANAVVEAIRLGVPVLATRIEGNRGLLGDDYSGLFGSDDAQQLADLLKRCVQQPSFVDLLQAEIRQRQPLFQTDRETKDWVQLLTDGEAQL